MKSKFFRAEITEITNADYGSYERYPNVIKTSSTLYQLPKHPTKIGVYLAVPKHGDRNSRIAIAAIRGVADFAVWWDHVLGVK